MIASVFKSSKVLMFLFIAVSCNNIETKKNQLYKISGLVQGSYYAISLFAPDTSGIAYSLDSLFKRIDESVSVYNPNSIISKINKKEKVALNDVFIEIFNISRNVSEKTNGAFDITVGRLVGAWGFGFKKKEKPDETSVQNYLNHIGWNKVILSGNELTFQDTAIELDFNAIAQGYTAEYVSKYLLKKGISNFIVDIGGEVVVKGTKENNEPWKIGIEKPSFDSIADRELEAVISISDRAVATSGNYRKYYIENGLKYSHTIDPKTGYPVRHHLHSVTVLADDCSLADAYATAFMVMGKDSAMNFIKKNPKLNLEAFFIYSDKDTLLKTAKTDGFPL